MDHLCYAFFELPINISTIFFHQPTNHWWFFHAIRHNTSCFLPFLPPLFNVVLKVIDNETEEEREIKGIQVGKEDINLSLFINDINIYAEDPKE